MMSFGSSKIHSDTHWRGVGGQSAFCICSAFFFLVLVRLVQQRKRRNESCGPIAKRDEGRVLECMLTRFMTRAAKGWQSLQFNRPLVAQVQGDI